MPTGKYTHVNLSYHRDVRARAAAPAAFEDDDGSYGKEVKARSSTRGFGFDPLSWLHRKGVQATNRWKYLTRDGRKLLVFILLNFIFFCVEMTSGRAVQAVGWLKAPRFNACKLLGG